MDNLERSRLLTEIYFYAVEKRQGARSRSIFNSQTHLTASKKQESTCNPLISFADVEVDAPQDPFENLMRQRGLLPPKYTYIPKFCLHFRQFTNTHPRLYPLPHSHQTGESGRPSHDFNTEQADFLRLLYRQLAAVPIIL